MALVADDFGLHVVTAGNVVEDQRCAFWSGEPLVAPGGHRGEDRIDLSAFVGEAVLVAERPFLIGDAGEETLINEFGQVVGEDVAADP